MKQRAGTALRLAAPLRLLTTRFVYLMLVGMAVGIMLVGKADPNVFERTRMVVADSVAPILDALSRPAATVADMVEEMQGLAQLRDEVETLRAENAQLRQWQSAARVLMAENGQLRGLLNYVPDDPATSVSARVIGDAGGAFVRSLLVNAGRQGGVRKGQAAFTGDGLLGRVAEVGERSARILLVTDLNSRIPVVIESTRERAILAGDNSHRPRLIYLGANSNARQGDRIVTSGHGGVFPPGLPVGVVAAVGETGVRVAPFADWQRIEHVRLMDFGRDGVLTEQEPAAVAPDE